MNNENRIGKFTSSQMSRLMASLKNGTPSSAFYTYVEEKAIERRMGCTLDTDIKTRPILWGRLMEMVIFDLLGMSYKMTHKETKIHPVFPFFAGTPDLEHAEKAGEIKCYGRKKFGQLAMCLLKKDVALFKENFKEEYWQTIANAILTEKTRAEIILYMPYKKELLELLELVQESNFLERNGLDPNDFYWFRIENIETMSYLPDDSGFSNINSFEFEVPEEDVIAIEQRIVLAEKELNLILN